MTRDPTTGRFVSREWVKFQATKAHLTPYTEAGKTDTRRKTVI